MAVEEATFLWRHLWLKSADEMPQQTTTKREWRVENFAAWSRSPFSSSTATTPRFLPSLLSQFSLSSLLDPPKPLPHQASTQCSTHISLPSLLPTPPSRRSGARRSTPGTSRSRPTCPLSHPLTPAVTSPSRPRHIAVSSCHHPRGLHVPVTSPETPTCPLSHPLTSAVTSPSRPRHIAVSSGHHPPRVAQSDTPRSASAIRARARVALAG